MLLYMLLCNGLRRIENERPISTHKNVNADYPISLRVSNQMFSKDISGHSGKKKLFSFDKDKTINRIKSRKRIPVSIFNYVII